MATVEMTATDATPPPESAISPLSAAARLANRLWQQLKSAYVESEAVAEQVALEELLEAVAGIERRLYRLAGCPVAHRRPSPAHPR
jgi:hypothetical protein